MPATAPLLDDQCTSHERMPSLISQPNNVFVARRLQGRRCRLPQLSTAAALSKNTCMLLAFSRPFKLGIVGFPFVDILIIKIGKPSLNVSRRNENRDFLAFLPHANPEIAAFVG